MRRFAHALIAVAVVVGGPIAVEPTLAATCTAAHIIAGTCTVGGGTTGGGVDLWGDLTTGGTSGDNGNDGPSECPVVVNGQCVGTSPPKNGAGPTTVSDIESFRPRAPIQFLEPSGWSVRRVPTNFWTVAARHTGSGELLGNPAEVRFTPVLYRRYFGDGDRRTSASAGNTWSALGQAPWTRTATSHSYASLGRFRVRLLAWYTAEFRFGNQSWVPLSGTVSAWANELTVAILSSESLLVERPCSEAAVGCR